MAAGNSGVRGMLTTCSQRGECGSEEFSVSAAEKVACCRSHLLSPDVASSAKPGSGLLTLLSRLRKALRPLEFIQLVRRLSARLTIHLSAPILKAMRILLFITLMLSMAVAPAAALASCASMGSDMEMAQMASDDTPKEMAGMQKEDCADMDVAPQQSHDAGCAAACALVCPGFYAGIEPSNTQAQAFAVVQYAMPTLDAGVATPSHFDPPPPRF